MKNFGRIEKGDFIVNSKDYGVSVAKNAVMSLPS